MTDDNDLIGLIDFDGTLMETEPVYDACFDTLFARHGITHRNRVEYKDAVSKQYGFVTGTGWRIIMPATIEYLTGETISTEETEELVSEFTQLVCRQVEEDPSHLYKPSLDFCKSMMDAEARLSIHSGTEPEICRAFLAHEHIDGLFDDIVSSHRTSYPTGPYTRYKRFLMDTLMDRYRNDNNDDHDTQFFVYGDSNGDGFAAEELGLPFVMARTHAGPDTLSVGQRTIKPAMVIIVDGDGSEIPNIVTAVMGSTRQE